MNQMKNEINISRPVITKLLELGADPTIKDKTGRVPFTVTKVIFFVLSSYSRLKYY